MAGVVIDPLGGLSVKERRFVEAYLGEANGNGTRAARLAGYRGVTAASLSSHAYLLLRKPQIKEAVQVALEHDPLVPGRVERMRLLGRIARGEATQARLNADGELVEVSAPLRDQIAAIVELGKLSGDYDRVQKTEDVTKNLTVEEMFDLAGIPRAPREGAN